LDPSAAPATDIQTDVRRQTNASLNAAAY